MGKPKKDEFLLDVVNPIAQWMQHTSKFEVRVTPNLKKDSQQQEPSEVLLTTKDQSWVFTEAYWAKSFAAPTFDPMVGWVFWRFLYHIGSLFVTTILYALIPALLGLSLIVIGGYFSILLAGFFVYYLYFFVGAFPLVWFWGIVQSIVLRKRVKNANPVTAFRAVWKPERFFDFLQRPALIYIELFGKIITILSLPSSWRRQVTNWISVSLDIRRHVTQLAPRLESALRRSGSDELALVELLQSNHAYLNKAGFWGFIFLTLLFHVLTAIVLSLLYAFGLLLFIVIMVAVWLLALISGVPGIPRIINTIKKPLDVLLVGSLGDIRVFLDDPIQAQLIREPLEKLLAKFDDDNEIESIHIIAHSTGAAIAYETLALKYNSAVTSKVRSFFTLGSILNMVWSRPHRQSFDQPLRPDLKWFNFWTKYDPALAGPTPTRRRSGDFVERQVSNNDNLLSDHTGYWQNFPQVISFIVGQVWESDENNPFFQTPARQNAETATRKRRLLWLTIPRLIAWYSPLIVILRYDWAVNIVDFLKLKSGLQSLELNLISNHIGGTTTLDQIVTVTAAGAAVVALALLVHKLYKDLVWDYFVSKRGL